jgi:hypothetical protein
MMFLDIRMVLWLDSPSLFRFAKLYIVDAPDGGTQSRFRFLNQPAYGAISAHPVTSLGSCIASY